jgi:integrase/recombinase XerD
MSRLALTWAQQPTSVQPPEWACRLSIVRGFARHRSATDPRTQIPLEGLLPYRPKRARPYLYSDEEIRRLLHAALALPGNGGLRPWTYRCLFGLLSVSGLRISEARQLELQDIDLRTGCPHDPGRQIRQVSPHPLTRLDPSGARRLPRATRAPMARPSGVVVRVRVFSRHSLGRRRHPPHVLHVVSADRVAGPSDHHGPRLHDLRQHAGSRIMPGCDVA